MLKRNQSVRALKQPKATRSEIEQQSSSFYRQETKGSDLPRVTDVKSALQSPAMKPADIIQFCAAQQALPGGGLGATPTDLPSKPSPSLKAVKYYAKTSV